jgi:hypothetical protein
LLLENPTLPGWVYDWVHAPSDSRATPAPAGLKVMRNESRSDNDHLWTLNGIPVYSAPIERGASLLLARESFEQIEFSRLEDGRYVTVNWRPVEQHPELVDLVLEWHMRVGARKSPALWLQYGGKGNLAE